VSFPTPSSVYVTSIDGTYAVINKAAGVAKKPGQRKFFSKKIFCFPMLLKKIF
jgi:hypothetical protein